MKIRTIKRTRRKSLISKYIKPSVTVYDTKDIVISVNNKIYKSIPYKHSAVFRIDSDGMGSVYYRTPGKNDGGNIPFSLNYIRDSKIWKIKQRKFKLPNRKENLLKDSLKF